MGQEGLVFGMIEGPAYRTDNYRYLQARNSDVINSLSVPENDEWPWLNRSVFALPGPCPQGTYRNQVIHFGLSDKYDPPENSHEQQWLAKFEEVLRKLFWLKAQAIFTYESHYENSLYVWSPTNEAINAIVSDEPTPVHRWVRRKLTLPR